LSTLGRAVAGLAEAIQVRLRERDDVEHLRETVGQLAHALSALGQLTAEHATVDTVGTDCAAGTQAAGQLRDAVRDTVRDAVVMIPPGLLNRTARYLEACARLVRDEGILPENVNPAHADQLADAFATDAAGVRYYAGE
jgi:hypothetical protein